MLLMGFTDAKIIRASSLEWIIGNRRGVNNLGFHPWVRNINLNPTGCPSKSYLTAARMGLSAAEKQKRYRERKKAETGHDAMKKRDAERKRNARQKDTQAERKKERERKQKLRAKRKAEKADHAPYSAPASHSRAVKRVSEALPASPRKR